MSTLDAIIIGTGQAGPPLAARLAQAGLRVAIIEQGKFGGTCVNNGCTPTKTLIASAYVAKVARGAAGYGIEIGSTVRTDMTRVKARKDALVERTTASLEKWLRSQNNVTVYQGHARFLKAKTVQVGAYSLTAERIFIDVGGRPFVPQLPGVDQVPYLTSETMMNVDFLPDHLIVIGGSYVGLEFGQMYRRFGSRVSIVEMAPRLIGREDPDISEGVRQILAAEDMTIRLQAKCIALEARAGGVRVNMECADGDPAIDGTHVLLAVGRTPNTDDLGLKEAGIEVDERGYIKVDEYLRTSAPDVYALGDCNGKGAFTHTAYDDYEIVADNLLNAANRKVSDRITVYALFTDPPLGRAGLTEDQARHDGYQVQVGRMPMTQVARAREKGETQGFMKVVVDAASRRILGAAILGTSGDEVVQSLLSSMYARLPYTSVQREVRIHPTVSELLPTLLEKLTPGGQA
jgi:pyruvate/2-oxoglutarate dehydrogenase complex dihydrolipoamide dehydrogenase (E3) component